MANGEGTFHAGKTQRQINMKYTSIRRESIGSVSNRIRGSLLSGLDCLLNILLSFLKLYFEVWLNHGLVIWRCQTIAIRISFIKSYLLFMIMQVINVKRRGYCINLSCNHAGYPFKNKLYTLTNCIKYTPTNVAYGIYQLVCFIMYNITVTTQPQILFVMKSCWRQDGHNSFYYDYRRQNIWITYRKTVFVICVLVCRVNNTMLNSQESYCGPPGIVLDHVVTMLSLIKPFTQIKDV